MDSSVQLNTVFAWLGWGAAIGLEVIDLITNQPELGRAAILLALAGATLHVRGMVHDLYRAMHGAFELGREAARVRAVRNG